MVSGENTLSEDQPIEKKEHQLVLEIISHINKIDAQVKSLNEKIEEVQNIELVNKLDIINLRNEIEKILMTIPNVSPEVLSKFESLERLSGEVKDVEKWKEVVKEIRKAERDLKTQQSPELQKIKQQLYFISQKIGEMEQGISKSTQEGPPKPQVAHIKKDVKELENKLRELRGIIHNNKGTLDKIEPSINALQKMELKNPQESSRFCSNCGARLLPNQEFCSVCNKKVR